MGSAASGARRSSLANKKQRASSSGSMNDASPPQEQGQTPTLRATAMQGTLRLVALMSATIVALLVFELLQNSLGFWPALGIGFVAGIVARLALVWLERLWLRAAARRALAQMSRRADQ